MLEDAQLSLETAIESLKLAVGAALKHNDIVCIAKRSLLLERYELFQEDKEQKTVDILEMINNKKDWPRLKKVRFEITLSTSMHDELRRHSK